MFATLSRERTLAKLSAQMTALLQDAGFTAESYRDTVVDRINHEWLRDWGWKLDLIDLSDHGFSVVINLYIWLPTRKGPEGTEHDTLALEGLDRIVRDQKLLRYPVWRSEERFVTRIVDALRRGLAWFEPFSTRVGSLDRLRHGEMRKDSMAYRECETYLMQLPAELDHPACLLHRPKA